MSATDSNDMAEIVSVSQLESKISIALNPLFVRATDLSDGCGSKFQIVIVSECFTGKPLLAQHRLVHTAIEEERKRIHALTLKTITPVNWEKLKDEYLITSSNEI
mmetsp:Transcript_20266/g.20385  ORF Transcript_20266/g.20385 Transcript_20266/m.20385 type:complete len:105 (-) Transcript_20266:50-364(-)